MNQMMDYSKSFSKYLEQEKHVSNNTLDSYRRDVEHFLVYLREERGIETPSLAAVSDVEAYISYLTSLDKSSATITRSIASIRGFYQYLILKGEAAENPAKA